MVEICKIMDAMEMKIIHHYFSGHKQGYPMKRSGNRFGIKGSTFSPST